MNRHLHLCVLIIVACIFYSCNLLKSYNGELLSLDDCPQEIEGMSVKLQKENHPIFSELIRKVVITNNSCTSDYKLSSYWVKNDWEGDVNQGFGKYYFVDANFDGNLDVFFGGGESNRSYLAVWNTEKEEFDFPDNTTSLRCSVFSPSEDAIYTLSSYNRDMPYCIYYKSQWVDGKLCTVESLCEVWTDYGGKIDRVNERIHGDMTCKYAVFSYDIESGNRTEKIGDYEELNSLPQNWKDVVLKMKRDYSIEKLLKERPERVEIVMKSVEYNSQLLSHYRSKTDEAWIDMGVVADDSTQLLWANGDLILRGDNTLGISDYAYPGSSFGWGDVSGRADETSSEFRFYGGENPPSSIAGNPKYDIVSAYFGSSTRLPTKSEWNRLLENCETKFLTIYRELPPVGDDGLPSWAQGQWMAQMKVGNSVLATSIKIDGIGGSIIATQGGSVTPLYDGTFNYDSGSGLLTMGDFQLYVHTDRNVITTDTGWVLQKVSNNTDSRKVYGLMLTSKINGEKLFFPFDIKTNYWSGTVADEDSESAYTLHLEESSETVTIGREKRNIIYLIRPVSSKAITITLGFGRK